MYSSSIDSIFFISSHEIVFIINLLSCEKKKKLPLDPAPSPALNTLCLLASTERDSFIYFISIPSIKSISLNFYC